MRRTYVRRALVGLTLLGLLAVLGPFAHAGATEQGRTSRYVVRSGDTLWSIASRVGGAGSDPRPLIYRIEGLNHLVDGQIVPGQTLTLPGD